MHFNFFKKIQHKLKKSHHDVANPSQEPDETNSFNDLERNFYRYLLCCMEITGCFNMEKRAALTQEMQTLRNQELPDAFEQCGETAQKLFIDMLKKAQNSPHSNPTGSKLNLEFDLLIPNLENRMHTDLHVYTPRLGR